MGWISYALGNDTAANIHIAAAGVISEHLGDCEYSSSPKQFTYTFGGVTYTVPAYTPSSARDYVLFMNTDTGEFCVSRICTASAADSLYSFMTAGIFSVQTDAATAELSPVNGLSQQVFYNFSIPYPSYENTTKTLTVVPVATHYYFSENARYRYKPLVNMFTACVSNVAVGLTIQVAGQNFLCICPELFVKV